MPETSRRPHSQIATPALASAPNWLRPGVVVHDPSVIVDRLIVDFASELRTRGFVTRGYARQGAVALGETPLSIDLATGKTFVETPQAAQIQLARAMKDNADLFAIGRFPACTQAAGASGLPVGAGSELRPVLEASKLLATEGSRAHNPR